jgi:hypothetical protein
MNIHILNAAVRLLLRWPGLGSFRCRTLLGSSRALTIFGGLAAASLLLSVHGGPVVGGSHWWRAIRRITTGIVCRPPFSVRIMFIV